MTEPTTPNKLYTIPNTGDLINAWGTALNTNFGIIDSNLSATVTVPVTNGTVNLTTSNIQNLRIVLTGSLTGNVTLVFPTELGFYSVGDYTTRNGYTIIAEVSGHTRQTPLTNNSENLVYIDGAAVAPLAAPDTFSLFSPSSPGTIIFPNGFIMQMGYGGPGSVSGGGAGNYTITYPYVFPNVAISTLVTSSDKLVKVGVTSNSTNSFTYNYENDFNASLNGNVNWVAFGY